MRFSLFVGFLSLFSIISRAQPVREPPKPTVYSSSSPWQKVFLSSSSAPYTKAASAVGSGSGASASDFRPAFTADFLMNRNRWKAGNQGDYRYQVGEGEYSIRKQNIYTQETAFSSVALPADINLNRADVFTIKLDVLADSGRVATGGVLFGVKDSLNFCAFTTNAKGEVTVRRVVAGQSLTDYMPGAFFKPGVPVEKNRNRLIIKRRGDYLHFYVNDQEIRSSPYLFRTLSGNGIGLTSTGYWTAFQKLSVTTGL